MIRKTHQKWFEVWGTEVAQNKILKGLLTLSVILVAVEALCFCAVSLRGPKVFSVTAFSTLALEDLELPAGFLQSEIKRAIRQFVLAHHNWTFETIEQQMELAAKAVAPEFEKMFAKANAQQIKIAQEKKLSQRFHLTKLEVDSNQRKAVVEGDRIIIIEGLHAVQPMRFEVTFGYGNRTEKNSEGIYVFSEDLLQGTGEKK